MLATLEHVATSRFEHVTYTDAIRILEAANRNWEFPVHWGADLQSEHERYLTEEKFKKPVIVTDYPKAIKAFYMRDNDDGKTVRAMDVLAPRIGEIIGGSQREERHDVLLEKIRAGRPSRRSLLVVPRASQVRFGAARRLRPGARAHADVPHRHEEHPRRHPLLSRARERRILKGRIRLSPARTAPDHHEATMTQIVNPDIEAYLRRLYDDGDPVRRDMEALAAERRFPIVGPLVGRDLLLLARAIGARKVFELGSGFGYSALFFAKAVGAGRLGTLHRSLRGERAPGQGVSHPGRRLVAHHLPPRRGHRRRCVEQAAPGTSSTTTSTRTAIRRPSIWRTSAFAPAVSSSPTTCSGRAACSSRKKTQRHRRAACSSSRSDSFRTRGFLTSIHPTRDGVAVALRL